MPFINPHYRLYKRLPRLNKDRFTGDKRRCSPCTICWICVHTRLESWAELWRKCTGELWSQWLGQYSSPVNVKALASKHRVMITNWRSLTIFLIFWGKIIFENWPLKLAKTHISTAIDQCLKIPYLKNNFNIFCKIK